MIQVNDSPMSLASIQNEIEKLEPADTVVPDLKSHRVVRHIRVINLKLVLAKK